MKIFIIIEYCSDENLSLSLASSNPLVEEFQINELFFHLSNGFEALRRSKYNFVDFELNHIMKSSNRKDLIWKIVYLGESSNLQKRLPLEEQKNKKLYLSPESFNP